VRVGETTVADVAAPPAPGSVNLVVAGIAVGDGPIELRASGFRIARGASSTLGVAGPGVEPGTSFAVMGIGFDVRVVRFGVTEGGGQSPLPAAVLALEVSPDVAPGLYSLIAVRGEEYSLLSGSVEVF
jgi:hypothetical protein